ncbi:MAG: hypothetical protein LBP89_05525 [Helicobacteraceae bacterium]|jgi:hypothetical protein|nr:hypothetical protein [Helicobacteraceae bacterium]
MKAHVDLNEQRATVDAFFLSKSTFENELFMINDSTELYAVMSKAVKNIIEYPVALATINFKTLQSYTQFRIEGCVLALKEYIDKEINYLISKEAGFDDLIAKEVKSDPKKQAFVLSQSKAYFIEYQKLFREAIADTFFERVDRAKNVNIIDNIVQEAIDGAGSYAPILTSANGMPIASKAQQIWMRLKQAHSVKDRAVKNAKENVERLFKSIDGINKNIEAINKARALTLEQVQSMTLDELKEIVVNEDGTRTEVKRIFQFAPSGDVAFYLAEQMDRARRASRNDIQKSEYKRAAVFYENCNINNTAKELTNKSQMMLAELPKIKEALAAAIRREEALTQRGLYAFDDALNKMREVFAQNIGKKRL